MMRRLVLIRVSAGALLLASCFGPSAPPEGMARLIVQCCELVGGTPAEPDCRESPVLRKAAVYIDGEERGTCANWGKKGAILAVGRHVIQVKVPLDAPLEEGECCVDAGSYVMLRAGQIHTQKVGLKPLPESE
jgi:hypothetical protein